MKHYIKALFDQALARLVEQQALVLEQALEFQVERSKSAQFGDFACNLALLLAKPARAKPRDLAQQLLALLPASPLVAKTEIAGPGFINVFLTPQAYHQVVESVLQQGDAYGRGLDKAESVLLEFVSANPTGPLHVGHGRGAAYGGTLANLLDAAGFRVHREYYVNDAGRQMDILAASVWLRYLELCGEAVIFPSNGYKGDYVWDIAASLHREHQDEFRHPAVKLFDGLPPDEPDGGDKDKYLDALINQAKHLLGVAGYAKVHSAGLDAILDDIRRDLQAFGVSYETWFSERSLEQRGLVEHGLERLKASGHTYLQDGALWFRSTAFGDEKDRVLVRENGQATYFSADIAYHVNKLERGFDRLVNIWGADHHGYVPRVKAAIQALDGDASRLTVLLVQFATLYRGSERMQMSTRSGEFVTLRELRDDVGNDAARFFYVQRKSEQHLEFDLELAKSQSSDNPVYYIQYAHARVASVLRELTEQGGVWHHDGHLLARLDSPHEQALLVELSRYAETIQSAAAAYEPHQLAYYLRELAHAFHTYYNAHKFLVEDVALRNARLSLVVATQQVLRNGLAILGVSAPDTM